MMTPVRTISRHLARKRAYLSGDRDEIASANLRFLRLASTATTIFITLLMAFAHVVIDSWRPSAIHLTFLPASAAFCALVWILGPRVSRRWVSALCALFEAGLYAFVILLDTVSNPEAPSSFTQLVCVALPSLFVLPDALTYGLLLASEAVYLALVVTTKDPFVAQYDLFELATGLLFSVVVSVLIASYRLHAYDVSSRYERLSKRDTLSALYNKRAFTEKAEQYLTEHGPAVTCSLAFIDLDDFKSLNDTLGHPLGDQVLAEMGRLLREQFRPSDIIGRFGGDEFLVLVDGLADPAPLLRRIDHVRELFRACCRSKAGAACDFSAGVVCVPGMAASLDPLLLQTDAALYRAKHDGRGTTHAEIFDPSAAGPAIPGANREAAGETPPPEPYSSPSSGD